MDALLHDVKAALRSLRARPGFLLAAILTLGLAIGANTAIFSVVEAVLLRQLPYRDPDRVFSVWNVRTDGEKEPMSIPDFRDLRAAATQMESMAAVQFVGMNLTGDGEPERIFAACTSDGWFETLGARPALGRLFLRAEADEGAHVAVLTDALWRRRFGADPGVLGKQVVLGDDSYEIVGVLPHEFLFTSRVAEVAVPLSLKKDPRASRRANAFLRVVARLRSGASAKAAAAELTSALQELAGRFRRRTRASSRCSSSRPPKSWSAPSARCCSCCSPRSRWCCWSAARTSSRSCWRRGPGAGGSSPCERRWALREPAFSNKFWSRA